jgi:hypothetical protein
MIAAEIETGQLIVFVVDEPIDDATVASLKGEFPGATILADLLDPLYESSMATRDAAHMLGRIKSELHSRVEQGARVVVICRRRTEDLGTRSHFVASLCASADRVHFLKST